MSLYAGYAVDASAAYPAYDLSWILAEGEERTYTYSLNATTIELKVLRNCRRAGIEHLGDPSSVCLAAPAPSRG
jgi:hypothetical protein